MENTDIAVLALQTRQQQKISVKMPLQKIFQLIDSLNEFDSKVNSKNATFKTIGIVLLIASIFILFTTSPAIGLIGITISAIFFVIAANYKSLDLSDEYSSFLNPLLLVLKDDIKDDTDVSLNIYLTKLAGAAFRDKIMPSVKRGNYECTDYFYKRNFITLKLPLFDGNSMFISGNQFLHQQERKRLYGKPKRKTKYASKQSFTIRLRYNPEKYSARKFMDSGAKNKNFILTTKDTPKGQILIMNYNIKTKGISSALPDPKITLEYLARLYSYLQPINQNK